MKTVYGWFKREAKPEPAAPRLAAQAPTLAQPSLDETVKFAIYRADAIARDIEQRRLEGREKNRDHDKMVAEAMRYAWFAVENEAWTYDQLDELEMRIHPALVAR